MRRALTVAVILLVGTLGMWLLPTGPFQSRETGKSGSTESRSSSSPPKTLKARGGASSIGTKEDPRARSRYRWQRLRDPSTGRIPADIRKQELQFAETVPKRISKASSEWAFRGPGTIGGRTRALQVDLSNESNLLAGGVSGGIWRSTDGGSSWTQVTGPDQRPSITDLEQDPRAGNLNVWYAGTGEYSSNSANPGAGGLYAGNGIYKSTDGGQSWTLLSSTTSSDRRLTRLFDVVWDVEVDPSASQAEVYAAVYGGIYRSTDGGSSWTLTKTDPNGNYSSYTDVAVTPNGVVYATLGSLGGTPGIFGSADGQTWNDITPSGWPSDFYRTEIAVNPQSSNEVWFLTKSGSGDGPNGHELWLWDNSSGSWYDYTAHLPTRGGETGTFNSQGGYDLTIKVHPEDATKIFVGGRNLWRLDVSGGATDAATWIGGYTYQNDSPAAYAPSGSDPHHPDQHRMAFRPSDGDVMYVGSDGGVHRTDNNRAGATGSSGDGAVTWTSLNDGYHTTQFYGACFNPDGSDPTIAGGMQDNGSWSTSLATTKDSWTEELSGDGGFCAIANNTQSSGTSRYVSSQNGRVYRRVYDSNGNETGFTRVDPDGALGQQFINPFELDPSDRAVMYYPAGSFIWRNSNLENIPLYSNTPASTNWTKLSGTDVGTHVITAVTATNANPSHRLYYGTYDPSDSPGAGRIYRLDNAKSAAESTSPQNLTSSKFPAGGYVSSIAVDPDDGDRAVVVFSNYGVKSLFFTGDGGGTWTDISGNLEANTDGSGDGPSVRWASILPQEGLGQTTYYVGTSIGLFSTTTLDGTSTTWTQIGTQSIGNVVVDQVRARPSDGFVLAATHGNGVYTKTAPLPVELAEFQARKNDEGVVLRWKTVSETNNAGFQVQRKGKGEAPEWSVVGSREGAGTTTEAQSYRFTDRDLPFAADTLSYRLKQTDTDGTVAYSEVVKVARDAPASLSLRRVFPNPASRQLTVHYSVPGRPGVKARLELFDVLGRKVRSVGLNANGERRKHTIDVTGLASGTYVLRLTRRGAVETTKISVVR